MNFCRNQVWDLSRQLLLNLIKLILFLFLFVSFSSYYNYYFFLCILYSNMYNTRRVIFLWNVRVSFFFSEPRILKSRYENRKPADTVSIKSQISSETSREKKNSPKIKGKIITSLPEIVNFSRKYTFHTEQGLHCWGWYKTIIL